MKNNMSIKKGKKQVYKVGQTVRVVQCMDKEYVGKIGTIAFLFRNGGIDVDLGDGLLVIASKVSPLKPKKSKRHVHEYIPFDANAYPTLEKYAEYHQCKCGKEKPKKSIKKTYKMKIYRVYRTDNIGYDEYDAWIVRAESPAKAKKLVGWGDGTPTEAHVETELITTKGKSRVILGSFNAG